MLLYYITARTEFAGDAAVQRRCLLNKIADAAHCGIDYIQLRENDLTGGALQSLAQEAVHTVRENCRKTAAGERCTRLLINSRTDVALSVGADGVHLRSQDVSVRELQKIWNTGDSASPSQPAVFPAVSVSCHSDADVARAAAEHADLAVLAPVFEKRDLPAVAPAGLEALRRACAAGAGCDGRTRVCVRPRRRNINTSSVSATGTVAGSSSTKRNSRSKQSASSAVRSAPYSCQRRSIAVASSAPRTPATNRSP